VFDLYAIHGDQLYSQFVLVFELLEHLLLFVEHVFAPLLSLLVCLLLHFTFVVVGALFAEGWRGFTSFQFVLRGQLVQTLVAPDVHGGFTVSQLAVYG
jgi:hypothetical protein